MRVTSALWVGAYIRRCHAAGAFAVVARRGSSDAGAILLIVDRLDGSGDLYAPAPQSELDADAKSDRRFQRLLAELPTDDLSERLRQETRFDPDVWVVTVEDREGRAFLDEAERMQSAE